MFECYVLQLLLHLWKFHPFPERNSFFLLLSSSSTSCPITFQPTSPPSPLFLSETIFKLLAAVNINTLQPSNFDPHPHRGCMWFILSQISGSIYYFYLILYSVQMNLKLTNTNSLDLLDGRPSNEKCALRCFITRAVWNLTARSHEWTWGPSKLFFVMLRSLWNKDKDPWSSQDPTFLTTKQLPT